jgi:ABC-type branched-subunit amino acid transport system ATPase component
VREAERHLRGEVLDLLDFIGLADYAEMPAGELSIGQRRLLGLGRAKAMKPSLLMLDEPAAGLSRREWRMGSVAVLRFHRRCREGRRFLAVPGSVMRWGPTRLCPTPRPATGWR